MQVRVYDDGAERDCLLVLGWGNRCRHENVRWLVDRLAERYRVHAVELPTHITDVRREWVDPVRRYAADLDEFPILAHSAGGLTTAHLDADGVTNRVYLSPWWGDDLPFPKTVVEALSRLPITEPFLPTGTLEREAIGDLATEAQMRDGPDAASPAFLRTTRRAHASLPPARENAVAFCSLTDRIVDPRAIGERLPADRIRLYDGGHELFSSSARDRHIDTVLDALERGPDALS
ncbi:alpha/beta hydrolase [Haloarcula nitratireducens]|uniref:Alpha/beta hydrolase n=1 Tax=Haloarcula nitratireducens TaxID=2487749 RepID=A0AAW4PH61_9EURY|nr:alpha/beta hydrolase [Halomicroarcula nitratireducens]MBX0297164.1 alpha/beta hydrolase [Halomicroarcula nitratireducens]